MADAVGGQGMAKGCWTSGESAVDRHRRVERNGPAWTDWGATLEPLSTCEPPDLL